MEEKIFEFIITIYGIEKKFKVYGKDYNEARQKLDQRILEKLVIKSSKDVSPKKDISFKDFQNYMDKAFDRIFGRSK